VAGSSLAPAFLIAMPQLRDPNFRRTVVLLVHHDEQGTFGVVLNRPTQITAMGLCASLDLSWCGAPEKGIRWGGPVQPQTGWLVFDEAADVEARDDVRLLGHGMRFAGSLDVLREVAAHPPENLHMLLGYAGWGPGQLEMELSEGAWLVAPVSRDVVFGVDHSVMWEHVLRGMGIDPSTLIATRGVH
jgi:putative transcriptional regulator